MYATILAQMGSASIVATQIVDDGVIYLPQIPQIPTDFCVYLRNLRGKLKFFSKVEAGALTVPNLTGDDGVIFIPQISQIPAAFCTYRLDLLEKEKYPSKIDGYIEWLY